MQAYNQRSPQILQHPILSTQNPCISRPETRPSCPEPSQGRPTRTHHLPFPSSSLTPPTHLPSAASHIKPGSSSTAPVHFAIMESSLSTPAPSPTPITWIYVVNRNSWREWKHRTMKKPSKNGPLVVSACGFDSVPTKLGLMFNSKQWVSPAVPNRVEAYVSLESEKKVVGNLGTFKSVVLGVANADKLQKLRRSKPRRAQPNRYNELSKQRLDHAILIFFQHFLKSYVGDQAMESSKRLYTRFSELLGLSDHLQVLNVIVGKIATNLKCYDESVDVITQTLKLFLEMASGYTSGKLLLKLDTVQLIIYHHNREHFPFLKDNRLCRSRTTFFYTIGLLVFTEDSLLKFKSSVDPLMQVFVNLENIPDEIFRTDTVKQALIGLMRDLRGFAMATNSRRTYGLLFDWIYPARTPLLLKAIAHWTDTPEVTTPLLKFMAEFVLNKSQRLTFDISSANGILLFREVSKLLISYGSRILPLINHVDMYAFKYKGIWISLTILSRALAGNYVNFGVFELYGDRALADALDISLKMALSVPLTDILAYRKLTRAYFAFLEILLKTQITFILNLDSSTFTFLAGSIHAGLKLLDTNILAQCASAADYLATFYFNHITAGELPTTPASLNLAQHVADCPSIFPEILKSLFEIVLFDDCINQWTLSRPMLSLILISEEMFANLKAQILVSQPAGEQQRLSLCFDNLMTGVTRSLDTKNRDRFTQNLTRFRNEFRSR